MIEINSLEKFILTDKTAVTLGKFDGLHLGHMKLIKKLIEEAADLNLKTLVFTFTQNPKEVLVDQKDKRIITEDKKKEILKELGIDYYICIPFTKEFSLMEPEQFIKKILMEKLNAGLIATGDDFCFGHNRSGNPEVLKSLSEKYGFKYVMVKKELYKGDGISSTRIREDLKEGRFSEAEKMLGRDVNNFT
ncbi:MAG: hypothetical protein K6B75_02960 [Lachnospiraceae bacterium]|nr:hypothetical protein [Lachnospiraceae bacterium]